MSDISAKQCLALIALAAALTACFDVQQVDVPSDSAQTPGLLIDDFESGDSKPLSPLFLHWFCLFTNGCGVWSPGNNSRYGYFLNFELRDAPNGKLDYPASGQLRTWRSGKDGLDFSHYKNLVFWAMLVPGDLGLSDSSLTVRLSCSGQGDAADVIATITSFVHVESGWRRYSLPLPVFQQFDWQLAMEPKIDASLCRTQIDGLGFEVQDPILLDGQAVSGTLLIDDVYLQ